MRTAVASIFPAFSSKFEGREPWMYLDRLGIVTTGVGNNITPINLAFGLGWRRKGDDALATPAEITADWNAVHARQDLAGIGGGNIAFQNLTQLRLSPDAIDTLVRNKLASEELAARSFFPGWDDLYADAQLGIMSMAWAMGAGKLAKFPKFVAAVNAGQWADAVQESEMSNPDNDHFLAQRNEANRQLFVNAGNAAHLGMSPDILFYPGSPTSGGNGGLPPNESPTTPNTPNAKRGGGLLLLMAMAGSLYWMFRK